MVRQAAALVLSALLLSAFPLSRAAAEARVQIVETDPAGETITLGRNETLWVRMAYVADEPVRIWARPFFQGREVPTMTNGSIPHSGSGYALGWFANDKPYEVDEIRIRLGGGKPYKETEAGSYRVRVIGTAEPAAARTKPSWVDELSAEEAAVRRAQYEKRMSEPPAPGDAALLTGFMLAVAGLFLASLGWPAWALWKWRGGWRKAAVLPVVAMAFVALRIVFDTARDPTSHNLWPFEILMFGLASVVFMAALALVRRFARTDRRA
jgi:hypothetical protein